MRRFLGIFLIVSTTIFAQTVNDAVRLASPGYGSSPRAIGMGNAFVSMSDDGAGMFYNPAGIALVRRFELDAGFKYGFYNNRTTFFGKQVQSNSSVADIDNFGVLIPIPTLRGSFVVGASYNGNQDFAGKTEFNAFNSGGNSNIQDLNTFSDIPFELYLTDDNYNTKINGRLNQSGSRLQTGTTGVWNFSAAFEAYRNFFLGATIGIGSGEYQSDFRLREDDLQGIYEGQELAPGHSFTKSFRHFDYSTLLDWSLKYYDIKVGLLYQIRDLARLGLTIQFPSNYTVKEDYEVNAASYWGNGKVVDIDPKDFSSSVEYSIITPFKFTGGLSLNLYGLIVSGQATLIDYTNTSFKDISGLGGTTVANLNRDISSMLGSVLNYNFGAEYTFPMIDMRVRAGYFVQKSPYKDDPSEYDKKFVTFGAGYLIDGELSIDAAYVMGWWNDFGDNYGTNLSRTYQDLKYSNFILGMSFRF